MLRKLLAEATTIAIGGHVHPDGDCVGSCMGLYQYVKTYYQGIHVDVYLEQIPKSFHFIQGTDEICHDVKGEKVYDVFFALDCGDKERLGFSMPLFDLAETTCCIDHHISNKGYADHNYIVPDASSTSELICGLLEESDITKGIAEALYMGIAHDTGVFQYSCTKPETMRKAAMLLEKGIDAPAIIHSTYYEKTYAQNQILGRALLESMRFFDGKCIVSYLTQDVMRLHEVQPKDLEGIVSQLRVTEGVEVAIFLYETDTCRWKVSLRSKEYIDVSAVASYFGGGGHVRAAGCQLPGSVYDAIHNIADQLELQFLSHEK